MKRIPLELIFTMILPVALFAQNYDNSIGPFFRQKSASMLQLVVMVCEEVGETQVKPRGRVCQ